MLLLIHLVEFGREAGEQACHGCAMTRELELVDRAVEHELVAGDHERVVHALDRLRCEHDVGQRPVAKLQRRTGSRRPVAAEVERGPRLEPGVPVWCARLGDGQPRRRRVDEQLAVPDRR